MTVSWKPTALRKLNDAVAYIAEHSPQAADKFVVDVRAAADSLASQPTRAPREPLLADKKKVFRSLIVRRRYKLIYFVDENTSRVVISIFWDTKQNPQRLKNWVGRLRLLF